MPTPEQLARATIDALLQAAGWGVCDAEQTSIHAARGGGGDPRPIGRMTDWDVRRAPEGARRSRMPTANRQGHQF